MWVRADSQFIICPTAKSPLRWGMRPIFKSGKEAFSLKAIHRYSRLPVAKFVAMNVLPVGEVVLAGGNQETFIRSVAEW